ncbi:MAG: alpha/beta hydrolase family protein [Bryobacteraceae bacterium]
MSRSLCAVVFVFASIAWPAEVPVGVAAKNISSVKHQSEALGRERSFNILLPMDYDASTERYAVLYLLHGYGDDNTAWSYMTNLSAYATHHKIIIVMPDASKSWYVNGVADPKARFEDYVVKDLIPYVDEHYRTRPLPRSRAVAGLTMGGYGAAFLGLKHHDTFTAMGLFSGAVGIAHGTPKPNPHETERDREFQKELAGVFGAVGSAERQQRDPFLLLEKVPPAEMPLIYVACGGQDFLLSQNRDFIQLLGEKKIPYEYREVSPRVHSWDFWDDQIRIFLDILDKRPGFSD